MPELFKKVGKKLSEAKTSFEKFQKKQERKKERSQEKKIVMLDKQLVIEEKRVKIAAQRQKIARSQAVIAKSRRVSGGGLNYGLNQMFGGDLMGFGTQPKARPIRKRKKKKKLRS